MALASTVIRFDEVTLGYGRRPAVHHLDGEIPAGSLMAVVGPNGAGKSTLLKGIVGTLKPLDGQIRLKGPASGIAYLPQAAEIDRSLWPAAELSVRAQLEYLAERGLILMTQAGEGPMPAFAQAVLTGTVRDSSGAVLPGVTVEASSPALIEKVRTAVTGGSGQFRIVDLRPGTYTLTATLAGFGTVRRDSIVLAELGGSFRGVKAAEAEVASIRDKLSEGLIVESDLLAAEVQLAEFRQQLVALCDADPCPSQVIQLNLQLFPLSQPVASPSVARAEPEASSKPEPARRRKAGATASKDPKP